MSSIGDKQCLQECPELSAIRTLYPLGHLRPILLKNAEHLKSLQPSCLK